MRWGLCHSVARLGSPVARLSGILSFWWMDRYVDMLFLLRALHLADTIFYQWMLYDGCAEPN